MIYHVSTDAGHLEECAAGEACGLQHFTAVAPRRQTRVEREAAAQLWRAYHEGLRWLLLDHGKRAWQISQLVRGRKVLASDLPLLQSYEHEHRGHELLAHGGSAALQAYLSPQRQAMEVGHRLRCEGIEITTEEGRLHALRELCSSPEAKALPHVAELFTQYERLALSRLRCRS